MDKPAPIFQRRNNTRVVVRGRGTRIPAASARSTSILTTTTTAPTTEVVEIRPTRRGIRRKTTTKSSSSTPNNLSVIPVSRNSVAITRRPFTKPTTTPTTTTTTTTVRTTQKPKPTTKLYTTKPTTTTTERIESEEVSDDVANILPAITSVRPRQNFKNSSNLMQHHNKFTLDTSTEGFVPFIPNFIESTAESLTREQVPTYDQYLQQQYKIKGLDVEESHEEEQESYMEDEKLIGVLGSQVRLMNMQN